MTLETRGTGTTGQFPGTLKKPVKCFFDFREDFSVRGDIRFMYMRSTSSLHHGQAGDHLEVAQVERD
ncbi:MAG: hypothetical protein WBD45_12780, partial [Terriglobales bacterium]